MLIIWGKKLVRKKRGYAGEFCVVCREVREFRVTEKRMVPHLYYIPAGKSEFVIGEFHCRTCGATYAVDEAVVRRAEKLASPDLSGMAARTSMRGPENLQARLELESRVRSARVTFDERAALLQEPFLALEYLAIERRKSGRFESLAASVGAVAVIAFMPMALTLYSLLTERQPEAWVMPTFLISAPLFVLALGGAVFLWRRQGQLTNKVYVHKHIARSLAPLRPTTEELRHAIATCRNVSSAEGAKAEELAALIARHA